MVTLAQLWFKYFEEKLCSEFSLRFSDIENDFTISPLVYSFLKHKQLPIKPREVIESSDFLNSNLFKNEKLKKRWSNLKKAIESGDDINKFMSKKNLEWKNSQGHTIIDYLYLTTGISHFHLRTKAGGGVDNELVFAICVEDKFYALMLGIHHDLYDIDKFKKIIDTDFPSLFFLKNIEISKKLFKLFANNNNYQPNLIYNMDIPQEYDNELNLIKYNIDGNFYKVPFKVYCAYENEIKYIEKIKPFPISPNGLRLKIDLSSREYVIYRKQLLKQSQELMRIPLPESSVLCSTYKQED
ncbi:hypothetical protein ACWIYZ_01895 [Ursidibacter arcticus]